MLATDGSPDADVARDFIVESGLFDHAEIRVLSVVDPGMPWWAGVSPVDGATSIDLYADTVAAAERRARSSADQAATSLEDLHVVGAHARSDGDVVSAILDEADEWGPDVIVLGARKMGTVHRWLVGSVSRSILHLAQMSVLIVRPKVAAVGERDAAAAATA